MAARHASWRPRAPTPSASTFDAASGRPYLYFGTTQTVLGGAQLEYLFDTATWQELTPKTDPNGYWGWYYEGNPTGFNNSKMWAASVYAGHLYRAAFGILDVHEIVGAGGPPTAAFTWSPQQPYANDPVSFTDQSTGGATGWSWTFGGANVSTSSQRNPSGIKFLSAGTRR